MKRPLPLLTLGVLISSLSFTALAGQAHASVCAQVDTQRDTLPEPDQRAAQVLLEQTLRNQGMAVGGPQGCQDLYRVSHVKFGDSITVFLSGPQGYRQGTARRLEDVPALYDQMIRSLVTGQPMIGSSDAVTRDNVTTAQAAPRRVEADSLWYIRLGYGGTVTPATQGGPSFGFGYRYELDNLGIDVSFLNFAVSTQEANDGTNDTGGTFSFVKLMPLYFFNPKANRSTYFGAGLSWGGGTVINDGVAYSNSGLQGEISAGYEFLRASTIRMFVQGDLTLPFYRYHTSTFDPTVDRRYAYAPTLAISLGLGWGRPATRVQVLH